jgi:hypothetical protein
MIVLAAHALNKTKKCKTTGRTRLLLMYYQRQEMTGSFTAKYFFRINHLVLTVIQLIR